MESDFVAILPVLPLAALFLAIARNVAGMVTFGVFTPLLLSVCLGSDYIQFKVGLLVVIFTGGLLARWLLTRVRLLSVSRLGIIFSLVVLSLSAGIEHLNVPMESLMFPFVIVVMMVERFITVWEENESIKPALSMLGSTVLCGLVILPLVHHKGLQILMREKWYLQIINLGALIAAGKYRGYRLTEWWRFRHFTGSDGK